VVSAATTTGCPELAARADADASAADAPAARSAEVRATVAATFADVDTDFGVTAERTVPRSWVGAADDGGAIATRNPALTDSTVNTPTPLPTRREPHRWPRPLRRSPLAAM
jgi:hypothetical protein